MRVKRERERETIKMIRKSKDDAHVVVKERDEREKERKNYGYRVILF